MAVKIMFTNHIVIMIRLSLIIKTGNPGENVTVARYDRLGKCTKNQELAIPSIYSIHTRYH